MRHLMGRGSGVFAALKGRALFLFLDFDGTLAPIADRPEKARLPAATAKILAMLARRPDFRIAIVSGRALRDVQRLTGIKSLYYVGNHGLEITGPGLPVTVLAPVGFADTLRAVKASLQRALGNMPGMIVEDKKYSLSFHFRCASETNRISARKIFYRALKPFMLRKNVSLHKGKMVFDVRPPVAWDKGRAVEWIMKHVSPGAGRPWFPLAMGDDITDEDAFRAIGRRGLSVFVGAPKKSAARFYLRDTQEVRKFLQALVQL